MIVQTATFAEECSITSLQNNSAQVACNMGAGVLLNMALCDPGLISGESFSWSTTHSL
jgi:hypothetical protein